MLFTGGYYSVFQLIEKTILKQVLEKKIK